MKEKLSINKAHDSVRSTLEKELDFTAKKVNLRPALELSISKKAYVEDMIPDTIEDYKKFNSREQSSIIQYVLLADLLKRGLWKELNQNLSEVMVSSEISFLKNKNFDWEDTIELISGIIAKDGMEFIKEWGRRMRNSEKDEMYKQRFGELDDAINTQKERLHSANTPEDLFIGGYNTAIAFPLGILKFMPDLLREKGIQPTKDNIIEYFIKNATTVSSTYAAQDIYSFGAINSAINPRLELRVADFSPQYFGLNESGKIEMKERAFEKIHDHLAKRTIGTTAEIHSLVNKHLNRVEKKKIDPDGKTNYSWKSCPALFANLITQYDDFLKPIVDQVLEIQKDYK